MTEHRANAVMDFATVDLRQCLKYWTMRWAVQGSLLQNFVASCRVFMNNQGRNVKLLALIPLDIYQTKPVGMLG